MKTLKKLYYTFKAGFYLRSYLSVVQELGDLNIKQVENKLPNIKKWKRLGRGYLTLARRLT